MTQKVRVNRYVTGKRPEYAPQSSSDEEDEDFIQKRLHKQQEEPVEAPAPVVETANDRRLARLQQARAADTDDQEDRYARHHRRVDEPEVIGRESDSDGGVGVGGGVASESEEDEEDVDEEEIERRRAELRIRARALREEEEQADLLTGTADREDDTAAGAGAAGALLPGQSSDEESEYEEYTDSEEEDGPMLKPVCLKKIMCQALMSEKLYAKFVCLVNHMSKLCLVDHL